MRRLAVPLVVGLGALAVACGGRQGLDMAKQHLGKLPVDWRRGSLVVSEDGAHWAFAQTEEKRQRVVRDGRPEEFFVGVIGLKLAPKTGMLAYWATNSEQDPREVLLVVEDKIIATPYNEPGVFVFAPTGKRWAVAGAVRMPPEAGESARGPTMVLVDGREVGRWKDATPPEWSPDGEHVAWLAEEDDGRVSVYVDGAVRRTIDKPGEDVSPAIKVEKHGPSLQPGMQIRWLSDGSLLTLAPEPGGWTVARDGRPLAALPHAMWDPAGILRLSFDLRFASAAALVPPSLDAAKAAPVAVWWERLRGDTDHFRVVRDGAPVDDQSCDIYPDSQWPPTVSPDGRHVAYACQQGLPDGLPHTSVMVDGQHFGPYVEVYGVAVSDEGGHAAWAATMDPPSSQRQQWTYFVDGRARGPRFEEVWRPRLDREGRHLAWEAAPEREPWIGFDRLMLSRFDDVYWGPDFADPHHVSWIVRRGRRVVRLTLTY